MTSQPLSRAKTIAHVLGHASKEYGRDLVGRMAAAISYRTVFALAPILVIAVSIAGFVLGGDQEAQVAVVNAIEEIAGSDIASIVGDLLTAALEGADTAAVIGVALLLWSSSTLFLELQRDLNEIFHIPLPEEKRVLVVLFQRLVGVLWTVGAGVLLTALFATNTAVQVAGDALGDFFATDPAVLGFVGILVSLGFMVLVFALIFQTLTRGRIPWAPIWVGATFTAVAFVIAGYLTGLYFRAFGEPTAIGITGSLVVLLFLAFLLSSVFLFGAQVANSYLTLVYQRDRDDLLFVEDRSEFEPQSTVAVSVTAVATFLLGLFVGRRNRDR